MDTVLSIILITVVCALIAYFLLQAYSAGVKIWRRHVVKVLRRDKANQGVSAHANEDESSQVRSEKQKKEDELMKFEGQSINRSDLYEGVRGNRNPFEEVATSGIVRNPLWMKQKEVEEEPAELQFWQAPNRGQVERDDDEVADHSYDPNVDSNAPPPETEMFGLGKKNDDDDDQPPALALATPQQTPRKQPKTLASIASPSMTEEKGNSFVDPVNSMEDGTFAAPNEVPAGRRGHRRIKSHDDDDVHSGGVLDDSAKPKAERDES